MATGLTTYGDILPRTAGYAQGRMLAVAEPELILQRFAKSQVLPPNKSRVLKMRRPRPLGVNIPPLVEGVTPSATKITYDDVTFTVRQFGGYVEITDVISVTHEDPVLNNAFDLTGQQAANTVETLLFGSIIGGTSVYYTNGTARTDVNTPLSINVLRGVSRALHRQHAKKITSIVSGSVQYQTKPVEASWVAIIHPDLESDVRNLTGFIPVAQYGNRTTLCNTELGNVEEFRFVSSTFCVPWENGGGAKNGMESTGGTYANVYPVIVLAQDAIGSVALKGLGTIKPSVLAPNTPRGGDPLGQRGTVGWKLPWGGGILNETWMVRIEAAATDL